MKPSKKAWKPKDGDNYYVIYLSSYAAYTRIDGDVYYKGKNENIISGNYFRTRRAAQKAARAVREVLKNSDRG